MLKNVYFALHWLTVMIVCLIAQMHLSTKKKKKQSRFRSVYFRYFWRIHSESCSVFDMWQGEEECNEFFCL